MNLFRIVFRRVHEKIVDFEDRFSTLFSRVFDLKERMTSVEKNLKHEVDYLKDKGNQVESQLHDRIDKLEKELSEVIGKSNKNIYEEFQQVNRRFDKLKGRGGGETDK